MPDKHVNGKQDCPKCSPHPKRNLDWFLSTAKELHGDLYDYSDVVFTKVFAAVIINCPKHGPFRQTIANHIHHKQRCPACGIAKSRKEIQWLNMIGIPDDKDHRVVSIKVEGKRYLVDGFDPKTNTVYEFDGDYWHGNPAKFDSQKINAHLKLPFGDLYKKTERKTANLKKNGYNVVQIWESDFDKLVKQPKRSNKRTT